MQRGIQLQFLLDDRHVMRRCCFTHLKNSSTCQRLLYSAQMVLAGSGVWLIMNTRFLAVSGSR